MIVREQIVDAKTGEVTFRDIDLPGVLTAEEAAKLPDVEAIMIELAENDRKIIRAIAEGDTARIAEHNARQAALRAAMGRPA